MQQNWKMPTGGLLLAGLAAYAWYKYSHMSEEERTHMLSGLKEKGQKWYDQYIPQNLKNMFGQQEQGTTNQSFGQSPEYMA